MPDERPDQGAGLGEVWRPFRTWVGVLLRATAGRRPHADGEEVVGVGAAAG